MSEQRCKLCDEGVPLKKYFDGSYRHFDGLMAWTRCELPVAPVAESTKACGCDEGVDHLCEKHAKQKAEYFNQRELILRWRRLAAENEQKGENGGWAARAQLACADELENIIITEPRP